MDNSDRAPRAFVDNLHLRQRSLRSSVGSFARLSPPNSVSVREFCLKIAFEITPCARNSGLPIIFDARPISQILKDALVVISCEQVFEKT